ncbi:uncharacterized protein LOC126888514 [Diabrotica virgifera virgifera]|uniref:Uncharacterized protein n=1 Tax=Diabrotica virgifera virgifera TaxID=50390 RepID=A0ABM5KRK1_DIAVI|nr:uncharacterized protein LOC126888514 [Diabrotica virgifera virgifera]
MSVRKEIDDPGGTIIEDISGESVPIKNNYKDNIPSAEKLHYDKNIRYRLSDSGPFIVYIESTDKNIGKLHAIRVGHYLHLNNFKSSIAEIKSIGRNKIKVVLNNASSANNIVSSDFLEVNNLIAYIPQFFVERRGLIRSVDTEFTEIYLLEKLKAENPDSNIKQIKRLKRRITTETNDIKLVARQLVCITFIGSSLPKEVIINSCIFPVEPYIYPVIQCERCLRYGHMTQQCKGKERCKNCGENHSNTDCSMVTKCLHCNQQHSAFNKFSLLANDSSSFPPLPSRNVNLPSVCSISKPRVVRRNSISSNTSESLKERRLNESENIDNEKVEKNTASSSILPNPYRDEFMMHKEKIVEGISNIIFSFLSDVSNWKASFHNDPNLIKKQISKLLENLSTSNGT